MNNNIIRYTAIAAVAGLFLGGCTEEVDNSYSRFPAVIDMTASAEEIVLNEDTPDDVALTITWTAAKDYGPDYLTTYQYQWDLIENSSERSEYEDMGNFTRTYTHAQLQEMMVDDFGYTTSTWGTMRFTITAEYEGTPIVLPDEDQVEVRVKTYGPKQFAADRVYLGGTAVGAENIELTASETNPDLYVYNGNLSAGEFSFPVVYGDENNVIIPAGSSDVTVESGETYEATVVGGDETGHSWIVTEADSYRVSLNFSNRTVSVIKTSEIMEIDRLFMAGTAVGTEVEIMQTLENSSLYAWKGELSAGTLSFPIEFGGERNLTMVPNGNEHSFNDGQGNPFTTVNATAAATRYWEITESGTYRIVVDTDARAVTIYSSATDMPLREYSWNNTQAGINPFTAPVEHLWMWGDFDSAAEGNVPSDNYIMTPSFASPYVFTYQGELGSGTVKFLVSNVWNNVYAFGAYNVRDQHMMDTQLDVTYVMVPGQGNNRYSRFAIPEGTNLVIVDITDEDAPTVVFRHVE